MTAHKARTPMGQLTKIKSDGWGKHRHQCVENHKDFNKGNSSASMPVRRAGMVLSQCYSVTSQTWFYVSAGKGHRTARVVNMAEGRLFGEFHVTTD